MKKMIALALCAVLLLAALCACTAVTETGGGKLKVLATIFPQYDWIRSIAGDKAEVGLLIDSGVDLHSYRASARDIMKISDCDMLICIGGESEEWVEDALAGAKNKNITVVRLMDLLENTLIEEEEESEEGEREYDEHIWLSLENACACCRGIAAALAESDPDNADEYRANAEEYARKLEQLDKEYAAAVENAPVRALVFADRFPFAYLADDYGIDHYAAFPGCSAETEASFKTIITLANKVDELSLAAIMTTESSDLAVARTVKRATKSGEQEIYKLDSMQSVTREEIDSGATYIEIMESNLEILKKALRKEDTPWRS